MAADKSDLLQGTLDMLILKALQREVMHGFGLALRIKEMSHDVFQVEMGSLYPALCRLEARGWINGSWGVSDSNRRARFYRLTANGRRQLREETAKWETLSGAINLILRAT